MGMKYLILLVMVGCSKDFTIDCKFDRIDTIFITQVEIYKCDKPKGVECADIPKHGFLCFKGGN